MLRSLLIIRETCLIQGSLNMADRHENWKSFFLHYEANHGLRPRNYIPRCISKRKSHFSLKDICKNIHCTTMLIIAEVGIYHQ